MTKKQINWHTEQRKLGDLKEWKDNPRYLSEHDADHLRHSLDTFGLADPIIINTDNQIIGGHQRKKVINDPDAVVDVRVPDRKLTEREATELAIRLNKAQGDWDFEVLKIAFSQDDLIEWGFTEFDLGLEPPKIDFEREWQGMPEFKQGDIMPIRTMLIHFQTEEAVVNFSQLLGQTISEKTKSLWFPKMEKAAYGRVDIEE